MAIHQVTGRVRTAAGLLAIALVASPALSGAESAAASAAASSATAGRRAAALWEASLQGRHGTSPDVTVRQIARMSTGGSQLRIRLGNPFGTTPVQVREAWAGRTTAPASKVPALIFP